MLYVTPEYVEAATVTVAILLMDPDTRQDQEKAQDFTRRLRLEVNRSGSPILILIRKLMNKYPDIRY